MIELIKPCIDNKSDVLNFLKEWTALDKSRIHGSGAIQSYDTFESWLHKVNIVNLDLIQLKNLNRVPQRTFLAYEKNKLIGFVSIRSDINDNLIKSAVGHVSYSVRPTERKKGYATQMLAQAVEFLKQIGLKDIYIGCNINNLASKKVIEKCGGEFFSEVKINEETEQCFLIKV